MGSFCIPSSTYFFHKGEMGGACGCGGAVHLFGDSCYTIPILQMRRERQRGEGNCPRSHKSRKNYTEPIESPS